jgi:small subunit ribosomal protein S18
MTEAAKKKNAIKYRRPRRKVCMFSAAKATDVDYKDLAKLKKLISERGKIIPRRTTGTRAWFQRKVAKAIKRARHLALLPFVAE